MLMCYYYCTTVTTNISTTTINTTTVYATTAAVTIITITIATNNKKIEIIKSMIIIIIEIVIRIK